MFRFDQRFTDNTTLFVRYNIDDLLKNTPAVMGNYGRLGIRPQNVVIQLLYIFSPAVINETKAGMNRSGYHNGNVGNTQVSVTGLGFSDLSSSSLDIEIGTSWNYLDNLTIMRGRHTLKTGVEIRRIWLNNSGEALPVTTLTYTSNQNLISNVVDSISLNGALGVGGNRRTFWMGFAQDEIKARPNLNLTLGVRYEYYSVMHEVLGRALVVDPLGCGGWDLSGTALARTGLPVNIVVTRSAANMLDGNAGSQRPDLVPGVSIIPAGGQTINQWWNIAAFAVPAKNTWGNSGRYIARAPGFYEMNTALEKRFPIRERWSASFRAEAFNLLNHAILNAPPANISTPATFGRIIGSSNPRKLQLMFRLEF